MKKISIIIISLLSTTLLFGAAGASVLHSEQEKRQAQRESDREAFLARIEETEAARKAYFESVREQKEVLRQKMEEAQKEYEDLLSNKETLVKNQEQVVTKTVEKTVPVTSTQTVTKPKSTKSTKTS